jgi:hypothetical protein
MTMTPPKKAISGSTLEIHFGAYGEVLSGECRSCETKFYTSLNPATAIEEIEMQYRNHVEKKHGPFGHLSLDALERR